MSLITDSYQTLSSTEAILRAALKDIERPRLTARPAPHEWSVVEVLCHLRDLENEVFPARTETIRKNNGGQILGFDQNVWAAERKYASDDPQRALDEFCAARRNNLPLIKGLRENELKFTAKHSEFGSITLGALLADWAGSDLVHTAQIQRIRLWCFFPEM